MAGYFPGESCQHGSMDSGSDRNSQEKDEGPRWYFTRKDIEENSPSRRDGIDLKKETYLRKSYCTFLQDLGMRLKVPQITIATAIVFCHRFFIRQSHAKNDRRTIATVCMFLAGKVEETPRPLKDVIIVSYEIINKKDPAAALRIKQKEVYEQQKELILLGERVVLATLGFDLNIQHPYKPLVEAIKKFNVAKNALAQVAWNFVNDGLRTSLCLQFKPHHIAAGAIFLAAKFLKVKLPSDGEKVWWQEFDVNPRQLEEVSNQMLELYEQNRVPPSQGSEIEGSNGGGSAQRTLAKAPATNEDQASRQTSAQPGPGNLSSENHGLLSDGPHDQHNDNGSTETGSVITDHKTDLDVKDSQQSEQLPHEKSTREVSDRTRCGKDHNDGEEQGRNGVRNDTIEAAKWREDGPLKKTSVINQNLELREGPVGQSPKDAIKMIDKDKVKAALEKRRKARGEITQKRDLMDEDDLIERELEDGIELAAEDEKDKQERRQSWPKTENFGGKAKLGNHLGMKGHSSMGSFDNAEEGEMVEDASPFNVRGRKAGSSPGRQLEGKKHRENVPSYTHDSGKDGRGTGRGGYADWEPQRRHL